MSHGGVPFGWRRHPFRGLEPDPDERAVIEAVRELRGRMSAAAVARN